MYGDGDGTVNKKSLEGCIHWRPLQKQKVFVTEIPKAEHLEILQDKNTLSYISSLIKSYSLKQKRTCSTFRKIFFGDC